MRLRIPNPWLTRSLALVAVLAWCDFARAQDEASPSLVLTRTRIVLEGRERSASLALVNSGDAPGTYRIKLINKRMTETGGLVTVEEPAPGERFADHMLRVSPRRVRLEPGESQNVRILARRPADLPPGEYRSHLHISLSPVEPTTVEDSVSAEEGQFSVALRARIGFSIPVIVRHGELSAAVYLRDLALAATAEGTPELSFVMHREGTRSVYGDLRVLYVDAGGEEHIVKAVGGIAVYTPNPLRLFRIPLDLPDGVTLGKGTLVVTFREREEAGGELIARDQLILD